MKNKSLYPKDKNGFTLCMNDLIYYHGFGKKKIGKLINVHLHHLLKFNVFTILIIETNLCVYSYGPIELAFDQYKIK